MSIDQIILGFNHPRPLNVLPHLNIGRCAQDCSIDKEARIIGFKSYLSHFC